MRPFSLLEVVSITELVWRASSGRLGVMNRVNNNAQISIESLIVLVAC